MCVCVFTPDDVYWLSFVVVTELCDAAEFLWLSKEVFVGGDYYAIVLNSKWHGAVEASIWPMEPPQRRTTAAVEEDGCKLAEREEKTGKREGKTHS
ncbi:Uncharacterized protein TCM_026203 [Theobroma cacao]|uniref:Uncharacterized protein n=1 Tax=Theobroma cacao TaxID=3641 RepID=A0A061F1Y9_THECC|nr:Uncharacterized protein TCM_026203 [Theobroma cacao]